ncbi:hypothetical protein [Gordonia sp. (in: high G+C Gram-positive bacteria)]|uniref:hypothetical protein n=1 Tax=Gordonia sp. (in: high G+C Gram-positive bacteria) TaxID=84139 RepID=UPI0039E6433F
MRTNAARLTVGLVGAAAAATLLSPTASGLTPAGAMAARPVSTTPAPVAAPPARPYVVITTAPIGTAGPAAPAPIVLVGDRAATPAKKDGYVNEQEWAQRYAQQGAAQVGIQGLLYGALAGAIIGGLVGLGAGLIVGIASAGIAFLAVGLLGVAGAVVGAGIGAVIGGIAGTITGAVNGYNDGLGEARYHNRKLRQYYGDTGRKPAAQQLAAPLPWTPQQPVTVGDLTRTVAPRLPVAVPRELSGIVIPSPATKAVADAQRALGAALGVPPARAHHSR